jgi:hypothetical protein
MSLITESVLYAKESKGPRQGSSRVGDGVDSRYFRTQVEIDLARLLNFGIHPRECCSF